MRLFLAVPIPDAVKKKLGELQLPIPGVRWQSVSQFHITLRFYGETNERQRVKLIEALKLISHASFEVKIEGLGTFPGQGAPDVIWARVEESDALFHLRTSVEEISVEAGWPAEHRDYKPHVTLGKVSNAAGDELDRYLSRHSEWGCEIFTADKFVLYNSRLTDAGARHQALQTYPLERE